MRFYASEETFFKLNETGFHLARVYGGISVIQKQEFSFKIYYVPEKYKSGGYRGTSDILGLNTSVVL